MPVLRHIKARLFQPGSERPRTPLLQALAPSGPPRRRQALTPPVRRLLAALRSVPARTGGRRTSQETQTGANLHRPVRTVHPPQPVPPLPRRRSRRTAPLTDHREPRTPTTAVGRPHLLLSFAPLLLALPLIAAGAIAEAAGWHNRVLAFLADPVVALLVGLIGTVVVGRMHMGRKRVDDAITRGFKDSGQILILTVVGGSLAAVVAAGGLGDILRGYFGAHTFAPLLLVWLIAAVLHIAVGSVTISAITAAGILAPLAPGLGIDPVLIALAAGTGSLFAVHVTSNTFWLLQSLMGQTTRGTLKTCTVGVSLASVVAIVLLQPISLLFF